MGRQIIKQPNGKYCIFSSIVDNITHYDMSVDDIIEEWVNEAKEDIKKRVKDTVSKLEAGEQPYFQFTKSYEEMLSTIKEIHGKEECDKVKSFLKGND
jgi:hypothetical protein